jgi:hypothetical protein
LTLHHADFFAHALYHGDKLVAGTPHGFLRGPFMSQLKSPIGSLLINSLINIGREFLHSLSRHLS